MLIIYVDELQKAIDILRQGRTEESNTKKVCTPQENSRNVFIGCVCNSLDGYIKQKTELLEKQLSAKGDTVVLDVSNLCSLVDLDINSIVQMIIKQSYQDVRLNMFDVRRMEEMLIKKYERINDGERN